MTGQEKGAALGMNWTPSWGGAQDPGFSRCGNRWRELLYKVALNCPGGKFLRDGRDMTAAERVLEKTVKNPSAWTLSTVPDQSY